MRRKQQRRTLWEGVVNERVPVLWEPWMVEARPLVGRRGTDRGDLSGPGRAARAQFDARPFANARRDGAALAFLKRVRASIFDTLEREVK